MGKCKRRFHTLKKGRGEKNDFFNCPPALAPLAACNFPRKSLFPLPVNKKEKIAPVGFFPFFVYCRHVPFPRFVRRYFLLFSSGKRPSAYGRRGRKWRKHSKSRLTVWRKFARQYEQNTFLAYKHDTSYAYVQHKFFTLMANKTSVDFSDVYLHLMRQILNQT